MLKLNRCRQWWWWRKGDDNTSHGPMIQVN